MLVLVLQRSFLRQICLGLLCFIELSILSDAWTCGTHNGLACDEEVSIHTENQQAWLLYGEVVQNEFEDSELCLLQRNAQILRKTTVAAGSNSTSYAGNIHNVSRFPSLSYSEFKSKTSRRNNRIVFINSTKSDPMSNGSRARTRQRNVFGTLSMFAHRLGHKGMILIVVCCVLILFPGIGYTVTKLFDRIIGEVIEIGIEFIADEIFGLDVTFGSMRVGIFGGSVFIRDIKIANPPGWNYMAYKKDHFLEIDVVSVHINLWHCLFKYYTRGIEAITVNKMLINGLDLEVEKSLFSSNVHDMMKLMKSAKKRLQRASKTRVLSFKEKLNHIDFTLHQLSFEDIGLTVPLLGRIAGPTIHYDDFDKEYKGEVRHFRHIVEHMFILLCEEIVTLHLR